MGRTQPIMPIDDGRLHFRRTKRPNVAIIGTIIPALVFLSLLKARRECQIVIAFLQYKEEKPLLPRRSHPPVIKLLEEYAAAPLDLNWTKKHKLPKRKVEGWMNGEVHEYKPRPVEVDEHCVLIEPWGDEYNPSCSILHEVGMNYLVDSSGLDTSRVVGNGSNRDVWAIREYDGTQRALKTVQFAKKFNDMNLVDRNRRDAVASEQLSASPYVMDIYGFCGNSALYDFGDGGELSHVHESNPTKDELLRIAHDVATAVADSHHVNAQGRATIAHADIKPAQFLKVNGRYQLNDFNRARFLHWDPKKGNRSCGFHLKRNGNGVWRAPEEYLLKSENEKIDVFSLGNVLYFLLTGKEPFEDETGTVDVIIKQITEGKRVSVTDEAVWRSTHPFDTTVLKALDMCFVYDKKKRSSAREVANLFRYALDELESIGATSVEAELMDIESVEPEPVEVESLQR